MGVPKFYRWLSERFPLINQRHGVRAEPELAMEHLGREPPEVMPLPDPLSQCGLPPPIDRLYIDMNGIIHGCSHNNDDNMDADEPDENAVSNITEAEIFQNVSYYLDRIVKEVAKPRELMYIAIDGVAPRAKLNQQRARRYRSAQEGEIEKTVYDAHQQSIENDEADNRSGTLTIDGGSEGGVREVEPGRFAGKFETKQATEEKALSPDGEVMELFHSNFITPGSPFFQRCTAFLEEFLRDKLTNDPDWKHLQIIFSGPNTPGEGEHKIMQFLREQKARPDYNPNLRHCIMGQDGDLIMLGLLTHEPNLVLLREMVMFDRRRRAMEPLAKKYGLDLYLFTSAFEFLHMNVLRDYIAFELETSNIKPSSPFDIERTLDDFVFLTFFVGNDFLPHMPALDIGDEALDLLIYQYRTAREKWQKEYEKDPENTPAPYLTHAGEIVSGKRLEEFLQRIGRLESNFYKFKERTTDYDELRKLEEKYGRQSTPDDDVIQAKESSDRQRYRELVHEALRQTNGNAWNASVEAGFTPVMASELKRLDEDDDEEGALGKRMGQLLHISIGDENNPNSTHSSLVIDDKDFKGRYYADKFGFSPYDMEKHLALRKAYIEGLVWNLRYYYQDHRTVLSWEWFYPYHYGPMISDLVDIESLLAEVSFDDRMGSPLKPFEQLLACLPASQSKLLPPAYQPLMTAEDSPIREFYPESFTVDMNGKRWPWEAVVLLPFINSEKLRDSAASIDTADLTPEELARNEFYDAKVMYHDEKEGKAVSVSLEESRWGYSEGPISPCFRPIVDEKTTVPLDGLPTLRDGSVQSVIRRRIRVDVHGTRSRYLTAVLEIASEIPEVVPLESLADLIGTTIYINYPSLIESFVTAVSNSTMYYRGQDPLQYWSSVEASSRKDRVRRIVKSYTTGRGLTGTGGLMLPDEEQGVDRETLIYVRPLTGLKTLPDGTVAKTFAPYEIEVPLFVLSWAPMIEDSRLKDIPFGLEADPYHCAKVVLTDVRRQAASRSPGSRAGEGVGSTGFGSFKKSYMDKRRFSSRPFENNSMLGGRSFCTSTEVATSAHFMASNAKMIQKVPTPRGRLLATGLLWVAAFAGLKVVQATSYSTSPQSFHSPWLSFSGARNNLFDLPGTSDLSHQPMQTPETPPLDFLHGTTTLSFKYQGGIVAAVDSRASLGNYIGSKTTQKVLPIHPAALGTMAGGAADCTFWIRRLAAEAALYAVENDGRMMSIARSSRLLANALYQNRRAGLSIGTMIMGYDNDPTSPPHIFYVDNSGMRIEGDMFAVGSGSTYAQGILDTERRYDMSDEEAISLGLKAIRQATYRDAGSGGYINVYLIKREGWKHVFRQDIAATQTHAQDID